MRVTTIHFVSPTTHAKCNNSMVTIPTELYVSTALEVSERRSKSGSGKLRQMPYTSLINRTISDIKPLWSSVEISEHGDSIDCYERQTDDRSHVVTSRLVSIQQSHSQVSRTYTQCHWNKESQMQYKEWLKSFEPLNQCRIISHRHHSYSNTLINNQKLKALIPTSGLDSSFLHLSPDSRGKRHCSLNIGKTVLLKFSVNINCCLT